MWYACNHVAWQMTCVQDECQLLAVLTQHGADFLGGGRLLRSALCISSIPMHCPVIGGRTDVSIQSADCWPHQSNLTCVSTSVLYSRRHDQAANKPKRCVMLAVVMWQKIVRISKGGECGDG